MNKKKIKQKQKMLREKAAQRRGGFHVYRSVNENLPFAFWERVTDAPVAEGSFNDRTAEVGQRYFYRLTQIDQNGNESEPFAPQTTFTDHAGNKFAQNPLADFAGYNIYRSADENAPLENWERRNDAPLESLEYRDEGVKSGEVYFYYIRAVDSRGVESAPGEIMRVIRK